MTAAGPKYQYQWRVSFDVGVSYGEPFPSKESAAEHARAYGGALIAECLQRDYILSISGCDILEILEALNEELVGDDDFLGCSEEQEHDLAAMVNAAIAAWIQKHAIKTTAFMFADVRNEEQIKGDTAL